MSNYHRELKKASSRPSAAQLAAQKRRMNLNARMDAMEARAGELEQQANDIATYVTEDSEWPIPLDDGVPPNPPQNVTVTPVPVHELDVTWDPPIEGDYVHHSVVEFTPSGGSAFEVDGTTLFAYANGLQTVEHSVRAKFVDRWGRESAWPAPVVATPPLTAAEYIDLAAAEIAGALGWENLEPLTDPDMLGDNVVVARAMAAGDAAFMNAWIHDAAIVSAKIASLRADKITTGEMTAAIITLSASGRLQTVGGTTRLDANGLALQSTTDLNEPTTQVPYKITNVGTQHSAFHFYDEQVTFRHRGATIRADGNGGSTRGNIVLQSTWNGNTASNNAAALQVSSFSNFWGEAQVVASPKLEVDGNPGTISAVGGIEPNYDSGIVSIGASSTLTLNHGLGVLPKSGLLAESLGGGQYKPLPAVVTQSNQLRVDWMTSSQVRIGNTLTSSTAVRLWLYKG